MNTVFRHRLLWASLLASATFAASAQAPSAPSTAAATTTTTAPASAGAPTAAAVPIAAGSVNVTPRSTQAQPTERDPALRMDQHRQRQAARLVDLKQKLALTPAQESAWQAFANTQQQPSKGGAAAGQRFDRAEFAKLTTPERLDRMQARQAERAQRMAARAASIRGFYAALAPEQQKTFDAAFMTMDGRGDHHGWHHPRHHGAGAGAPMPKG